MDQLDQIFLIIIMVMRTTPLTPSVWSLAGGDSSFPDSVVG